MLFLSCKYRMIALWYQSWFLSASLPLPKSHVNFFHECRKQHSCVRKLASYHCQDIQNMSNLSTFKKQKHNIFDIQALLTIVRTTGSTKRYDYSYEPKSKLFRIITFSWTNGVQKRKSFPISHIMVPENSVALFRVHTVTMGSI